MGSCCSDTNENEEQGQGQQEKDNHEEKEEQGRGQQQEDKHKEEEEHGQGHQQEDNHKEEEEEEAEEEHGQGQGQHQEDNHKEEEENGQGQGQQENNHEEEEEDEQGHEQQQEDNHQEEGGQARQSLQSERSLSSEGTITVGQEELPRFVVLKSNYNSKYLRYIKEDIEEHGFLQFCGEEAVSPYAKYEVEMAKSGKGLVNIRCCYNNKYWKRSSEHHLWLVAGANESEEDKSKWSCTLFEPVYIDDNMVRFRHVQLGNYACLWRPRSDARDSCLVLGSKSIDNDQCDVCTFIDWESLLILPRHVAFKGDNGKYLSARQIDGCPYLQFVSSDIGDPTVGNEVFTTPDGSVRIKSVPSNSYWKRNNLSWICPDSKDTSNKDLDTLFWPVKVGNNVVALRNLGNENFCMRLTAEEKRSCLSASISTISKEARLGVEELVLSRNIYNVYYRLMDARMYGQSVLTMATANATNTTQVPNDVEMKLSYTEHKCQTWNASVSLKLGIKTNIQAGVPLIATGGIELSAEFTGEYEWGKTKDSTNMMETTYRVTVPPLSKVTVSLLATQGSCDVPFSYSQRDALINGKQFTQRMEDGVYTGTNCFYFEYHTKQEKL